MSESFLTAAFEREVQTVYYPHLKRQAYVFGPLGALPALSLRLHRGLRRDNQQPPGPLEYILAELGGLRDKRRDTPVYFVFYSEVWKPVIIKPSKNPHKLACCFSSGCLTQPYGCIHAKRVNSEREIEAAESSAAVAAFIEDSQIGVDGIYMGSDDSDDGGPPDEASAYGKSPPGRGHPSALAEAPTVAAVAEVLSSLVSVLSPLPTTGGAAHTVAAPVATPSMSSAAAVATPSERTTPPQAVTPTEPASRPNGHSALKAALGFSLASHPYASGRQDAAAWQRLSAAAAPESNVAHAGQGQESPAGRSPLEWVAAGVTRPAAVRPSSKAAVVAAAALPGMASLLHPEPSMESPLERTAEALFPLAEAGAAVAPPAKATVAAVTPPPDMTALLHPEPSMESPLERAAEALFPVAEVGTVVGPRSAVDLPAKATVTAVTAAPDMAALLQPEPSMTSPLERAAAGLFSPPVATTPVAQGAAVAAVAGEARGGGAAPRAGRRSIAPPLWLMALGSTATLGLLLVITRYPAVLVIAGGVASVLVFLFPPDTTDA
ncbi:hypothetical protein I4F81_010204 [Pyropia yezoensis]|uniref:Uncharacterized protein n=1 Tax=Pyropia yezoensis TaxID=2788 RepID=A0ACC3CCN8_PYRYE|nr:hypothetical protein I4F81_010204 [Neopyropia yezoensis]